MRTQSSVPGNFGFVSRPFSLTLKKKGKGKGKERSLKFSLTSLSLLYQVTK
jgi:hypothetical protein